MGSSRSWSAVRASRSWASRERVEPPAKEDEHQVGLVSEHLHERRGTGVGNRQAVPRLVRNLLQLFWREPAYAVPSNAVHQVQQAPAFKGLGNRRVVHGGNVTWREAGGSRQ